LFTKVEIFVKLSVYQLDFRVKLSVEPNRSDLQCASSSSQVLNHFLAEAIGSVFKDYL